jgi:serine/threonine protein kinase
MAASDALPDTKLNLPAYSTNNQPLASTTPTDPPPPEIPGFVVQQKLGHGGMGVVYQALDSNLGRAVAVKMLLAGTADATRLERFRVESAALARLNHPHILMVHQAGVTAQGQPFLVTELVSGGTLAERCNHQPQDPNASTRLVLLLAKAVQAAHQEGILHRDLKPANVLLAKPAPEPALNCAWGWPKLADFGLAKFLEADHPAATRSGQIMGSPPYMAPEQVAGESTPSVRQRMCMAWEPSCTNCSQGSRHIRTSFGTSHQRRPVPSAPGCLPPWKPFV